MTAEANEKVQNILDMVAQVLGDDGEAGMKLQYFTKEKKKLCERKTRTYIISPVYRGKSTYSTDKKHLDCHDAMCKRVAWAMCLPISKLLTVLQEKLIAFPGFQMKIWRPSARLLDSWFGQRRACGTMAGKQEV